MIIPPSGEECEGGDAIVSLANVGSVVEIRGWETIEEEEGEVVEENEEEELDGSLYCSESVEEIEACGEDKLVEGNDTKGEDV